MSNVININTIFLSLKIVYDIIYIIIYLKFICLN